MVPGTFSPRKKGWCYPGSPPPVIPHPIGPRPEQADRPLIKVKPHAMLISWRSRKNQAGRGGLQARRHMEKKSLKFLTAALASALLIGATCEAFARSRNRSSAFDQLNAAVGAGAGSTPGANPPGFPAVSNPVRIDLNFDLASTEYVKGYAAEVRFTAPKAASQVNLVYNLAKAFEGGKNDNSYAALAGEEKYRTHVTTAVMAPVNFLKKTEVSYFVSLCGVSAADNHLKNALDLFFFASLYAHDIASLRSCAAPLFSALPAGNGKDPGLENKLYAILEDWTPEHEEFYYNMASKRSALISGFQQTAAALNIDPIVRKIDVFTGESWSPGVPFTVGLVPVPDSSDSGVGGRTYATAIHIPVKFPEIAQNPRLYRVKKVGIVVHEIFHSMLGKYLNTGANPVSSILGGSDPNAGPGKSPVDDLSEVLATAIGQGYVANHGDMKAQWHGFTGVDGAAKEMYDVFMEYLYHGKPIDDTFVNYFVTVRTKYHGAGYTWTQPQWQIQSY